jgi:hypothetical protein
VLDLVHPVGTGRRPRRVCRLRSRRSPAARFMILFLRR